MINIKDQMEIFKVELTIVVQDRVQKQYMEAPRIMIENQFTSLVEQAIRSNQPVKLELRREEPVQDDKTGEWTTKEYKIEYANNAWTCTHGDI